MPRWVIGCAGSPGCCGISQARLARTLGLSPAMLSQLASGRRVKIGDPAVLARLLVLDQRCRGLVERPSRAAVEALLAEVARADWRWAQWAWSARGSGPAGPAGPARSGPGSAGGAAPDPGRRPARDRRAGPADRGRGRPRPDLPGAGRGAAAGRRSPPIGPGGLTVRLFTALWVPPAAAAALRGPPPRPRSRSGWRAVDPETWHVTLAFHGEAEPEQLAPALYAAALGVPAPRLRLPGAGSFRGVHWVGVQAEPEDRLHTLVAAAGGDPAEFVPHVTLLRRRGRGRQPGPGRPPWAEHHGPWWRPAARAAGAQRTGPGGPGRAARTTGWSTGFRSARADRAPPIGAGDRRRRPW